MKTGISGNLSQKIAYYCRKPIIESFSWENGIETEENDIEVTPSFAVDPLNTKTAETAQRWSNTKSPATVRDNDPIEITIVGYEKRDEGGGAYKVVDNDGHYFDLRVDVMLDSIKHSTITHGKFDCKFIWGMVGSNMKLVRVDSELHKALIQTTQEKSLKKISLTDLEIGRGYSTRTGGVEYYMGKVSTVKYELESDCSYNGRIQSIKRIVSKKIVHGHLFFTGYDMDCFTKLDNGVKYNRYYFRMASSISYIKTHDMFKFDIDLKEICDSIRSQMETTYLSFIINEHKEGLPNIQPFNKTPIEYNKPAVK